MIRRLLVTVMPSLINGDIVRSRDAVPPGSAVVRYSDAQAGLRCQLLPTLVTWIVMGYFHGP